ncbi:glycosyltransferase family 2 protein [Halieaceae bacterium IMCC8485]|uniref:Glycosyltransferase family 2 protein n=1 Tax=Candidatus Seongchinamella marina TaxID=2518990 RepID=A0ABT3SQD1_9GAMM|nr:glycosyltransferase family 2 protein [Candidatus Seongchinamella marina]MCX2972163.1 glycosyltransferase family 2 protein [Candidatus Seongchinamella marina]
MICDCPEVAVLLCTFNGGRYLTQQIRSISEQTHPAISLYISDDGSQDDTCDIARKVASANLQLAVDLRTGPGRGATSNFLSLICDSAINADYFAYADQDDVWDSDKLSRAIAKLAECDARLPALYCARTRSVTEHGLVVGVSPSFLKLPSFANALVQNIGGGNTMVMNRVARNLLRSAGMVEVVSHDWWTYLLISGAGGRVEFDQNPCVDYRQHPDNQIGDNQGALRRLVRYWGALSGRNQRWNQRNIAALSQNLDLLTPESRFTLETFSATRSGGLVERIKGARKAGLYAQTFIGNLGLLVAILLKKI